MAPPKPPNEGKPADEEQKSVAAVLLSRTNADKRPHETLQCSPRVEMLKTRVTIIAVPPRPFRKRLEPSPTFKPTTEGVRMIEGLKLAVVLPAYNASQTLERTFAEIPMDIVDDVILVDDASTDSTASVAQRLGIHTIIHAQ